MNKLSMKRRGRRGVILLIASGLMFVLLAFVGLAFDVGFLQWSRRRAQTSADAAALAGAWAIQMGGAMTTEGKAASAINGFTDAQNGVTVTINNPPTSGNYTSDANAVEAIVSQDAPSYFMRVLGYNTLPVRARAVAKQGYGTACVYALNPTAKGALTFGGTSDVSLGCGAIDESSNGSGTIVGGSAGVTMTNGASIGTVGGYTVNGSPTITPASGLSGGAVSPGDPLATSLVMPTPDATLPHYDTSGVSSGGTLQPGVYCGGISLNSGVSVNFSPGLYILAGGGPSGGLQVSAANLTANGVTFYTTDDTGWGCSGGGGKGPGPVQINSTAHLTLTAPTTGTYAGIAMFQNRADTYNQTNTINGSANNVLIDGVLYFPTTQLKFNGTSDSNGYLMLIADKIDFTGGATLTLNNFPTAFANNNPAFKKWVTIAE